MFCWHKWTKWEDCLIVWQEGDKLFIEGKIQAHPFSKKMLNCNELIQRRYCKKCVRRQERKVKII